MDCGAGYGARTMSVLDVGPLRGRLLLGAWDNGIAVVAEDVAPYVQVWEYWDLGFLILQIL